MKLSQYPFSKILFPVDYSAPCEAVVPHIKDMARHFSADLTVVHAYGAEAFAYSDLPITGPDLPDEARSNHGGGEGRITAHARI